MFLHRTRLEFRFFQLVAVVTPFILALNTVQLASAAISASGSNTPNPTTAGASPTIGLSDIGRLTINGGSSLNSNVVTIGDLLHGFGIVTITDFVSGTGSASTWTTNALFVGDAGTGRLDIVNGGIVTVDFAGNPGAGDLVIGNLAGGIGTVNVEGLGSVLRVGDDTNIGTVGTGTLRISLDALVVATNDAGTDVDTFTVGTLGRLELYGGGRLRSQALTNNGVVVGSGRIDNAGTIANSTTGRIEANEGDRMVLNAVVDNDGDIAVHGGEIEFLKGMTNSNAAAELTVRNGLLRFPKSGFGFDTTMGVLATTGGINDIYGTVRLQGATSKILVGGESTAVFHDPVTNTGGVIEVLPGSTAIYLQGITTTGSGSLLLVHLTDANDQPDFGQVEVAGSAALAGNLAVKLAGGFEPANGDAFQILTAAGGITGSLNLASAPALATGLQWDLDINPTTLVLSVVSTGDYNGNGVVDAADYIVWRKSFGQSGSGLAADGNGNGTIDAPDYAFWRARFGNVIGSGAGGVTAVVPEPATIVLVIFCGSYTLRRHRRWVSHSF